MDRKYHTPHTYEEAQGAVKSRYIFSSPNLIQISLKTQTYHTKINT